MIGQFYINNIIKKNSKIFVSDTIVNTNFTTYKSYKSI